MAGRGPWLLALLLLGGFVGVAGWRLVEQAARGRNMPFCSVYSASRDGLEEAAHVLDRLGWTPVAVTRPLPSSRQKGLLVVAGVDAGSLPEAHARGILRWVGEGNVLLLASGQGTALHRLLGLEVIPPREREEFLAVLEPITRGDFRDDYLDDVEEVAVERRAVVRGAGTYPLWRLAQGPGAVVRRHGRGRVLVLADPYPLTREGLHEADNVILLANIAGLHAREGKVYFDEYHHGFRSATGFWGYLAHHRAHWLLLPGAIFVGVLLWRVALRLGRPVPRQAPARADAVEYASGLAQLYRRAGIRRPLGQARASQLLAALTRHLGLRPTALPVEVLAAWRKKRDDASAGRLATLLRGLGELRRGDVTEGQLLAWTREMDRFEQELAAETSPSRWEHGRA